MRLIHLGSFDLGQLNTRYSDPQLHLERTSPDPPAGPNLGDGNYRISTLEE